jgi:uncharacterized protein (TIGR02145 family)
MIQSFRNWVYLLIIVEFFLLLLNSCSKSEESTTNIPTPSATVTDIEGNTYKTVIIGTQTWMAENLKTTKYRNGEAIINVTSNTAWSTQTIGTYCWYSNATSNNVTYGALYNWYAVADSRNIAPKGWHIPSDAEWTTLTTYLGGSTVAGVKIKEVGTAHWTAPNEGATNETGFTAVAGGYRDGYDGTFADIKNIWICWSTTEYQGGALQRCIEYNIMDLGKGDGYKNDGYSVRCIKD